MGGGGGAHSKRCSSGETRGPARVQRTGTLATPHHRPILQGTDPWPPPRARRQPTHLRWYEEQQGGHPSQRGPEAQRKANQDEHRHQLREVRQIKEGGGGGYLDGHSPCMQVGRGGRGTDCRTCRISAAAHTHTQAHKQCTPPPPPLGGSLRPPARAPPAGSCRRSWCRQSAARHSTPG